jgi:eukaryotic-like serine/threonine-protein kinase
VTPERWQQVARVYQSALEQAPSSRAAFLANACRDDSALRREVESLLAREHAPIVIDQPVDIAAAAVLTDAHRLAPGSFVGPYRVTTLLGEGGMGQVYRAHDTKLQRDVALKILPDAFVHDADRVARFTREAQVLASLNHPNIGAIHGFEDSGPVHALVLELVEGPTLADRIARGPIPIDETLAIARQIAEALEAAHEYGIVHRDLKPANIKVRDDGTLKVLDFGLAKAIDRGAGTRDSGRGGVVHSQSPTVLSPAVTMTGIILGTAAYMSPEQARGKPADKRCDVWAFGCVLYEMLTGRRAFDPPTDVASTTDSREEDDVPTTLARVLQRDPDFDALPPDVPPRVRQVVRLCLLKSRKDRLPDIGAARLALAGAFETAPPAGGAHDDARPFWQRALPVVAAAVITGIAAGLAVWLLQPSPPPPLVSRFESELRTGEAFRHGGMPFIAMSRDGRHFVYNTMRGIYLRSLDDVESHLIAGTEAPLTIPLLSPDGESIAFVQDGSLKRVSIRGGAARIISSLQTSSNGTIENMRGPFSASWEADDTILIGHNDGISRVSANGDTPKLLIQAKQGEQFHGPRLLPDGDSVLFTATAVAGGTKWDQADIVVQSLATGRRSTLVRGGSDARYLPTGHLVYAVGDTLFAVLFDGRRLQVRGAPVAVVDGVGRPGNPVTATGAAFFDVSAQGTLVYARSGAASFLRALDNERNTLVWVDRQGREEPLSAPPRAYVYPRISPQGDRLALDIRDREQDVWIWDLRRQTLTPLSSHPDLDGLPIWTPDGQRVVWASQRDGPLNLYWQRADGTGAVERLTRSPNGQRPNSFTSDGKRLVFSVGGGGNAEGQNIATMSIEGERQVTPLLQGKFVEQNGDVSPDGRWLAYESDESGQFEVYVRPFPAVDQGRWQVSNTGGRQPAWSRDGRELFYIAADGALMSAGVQAPQGGQAFAAATPVKLQDGGKYYDTEGTPNRGRTYDVSRDGLRFLRIKQIPSQTNATRGSLVVAANWFTDLKRLVPVP